MPSGVRIRMWTRLGMTLIAATVVFLGGCATNIVDSTVSNKGNWRLSGDFRDVARAADGDIGTAASSGDNSTASIMIDLGKPCMFNTIILDHGPDHERNFPNRISVVTSYDGRFWTNVYVVQGTRRITYIPLLTPTLARYIRLQTLVKNDEPWTIAEIYLQ